METKQWFFEDFCYTKLSIDIASLVHATGFSLTSLQSNNPPYNTGLSR